MLKPPVEQGRVTLAGRVYCPVELRRHEVHPAATQPEQRVRKDTGVRVEAGDGRRHSRPASRTVQTEWTHAELNVWTQRFYRPVDALDLSTISTALKERTP